MEFLSNKVGSYQDSLKSSLSQVWNFFSSFFQNENIGNHLNNQNNSPEPLRDDEACTIVDRIMLDEPGNDTEEGSNEAELTTPVLPCNVITSEGYTEIWAAILAFIANAISKGRGSTSVILTQLNKRAVKWHCPVLLIFLLVLQSNITAAEESKAMHHTTSNHCNCSGFEDMCPLPHDCCSGPWMHAAEAICSEPPSEDIFSPLVSVISVLIVIACAAFSCWIGWNNRPENNQEFEHPTQETQITIIPQTTAEEQICQNGYTSLVESREEEAIPRDRVLIYSTEKLGKSKDLIEGSEAATAAYSEEEPDDAKRRCHHLQEEDGDPKPSRETCEDIAGSSAVVVHKPHLSNTPLSGSKFVFIPPAYSLLAPTVLPPPPPPPSPPPKSAKGGIEIAKMGEEGFFGYHCLVESEVTGELQLIPLHGNRDIFYFIAHFGE